MFYAACTRYSGSEMAGPFGEQGRKLGVTSRSQAVARSRELTLLRADGFRC